MADDLTRTRILDAAGPAFAEKGFRKTTIREICHAAGVNIAAVNYHFGDKQRLYIESVKAAHAAKRKHAQMPNWGPAVSPREKLRDFVSAFVQRVTAPEQGWQHQLLMREMFAPTQACCEMVEDSIRPEFTLLSGIVRELLPAEHPLTEQQHARIVFSIIGQCLFYRIGGHVARMLVPEGVHDGTFDPHQIAEHVTRFTLAALSTDSVAGASDLPCSAEADQSPSEGDGRNRAVFTPHSNHDGNLSRQPLG